LRLADVVVINKIDSADFAGIQTVRNNVGRINPEAIVIDAASTIDAEDHSLIRGKRVLIVEDGPTLTHGNMKIGAGVVAAHRFGAAEIIDPRAYAVGKLAETFAIYPDIGMVLPAMGYGEQQVADLAATIENTPCDSIIIATPIDLGRVIQMNKPNTRIRYALQEIGKPTLEDVLDDFVKKQNL